MTKDQVAAALLEIGTLLELRGENRFKVNAYLNGARTIEQMDEDLSTLCQEGRLAEVRGVGLLWVFEFCLPGSRNPLPSGTMAKVAATVRRHHLHMHKRDNLVYFAPPLVITDAELDEAVAAVGTAFDEAVGA